METMTITQEQLHRLQAGYAASKPTKSAADCRGCWLVEAGNMYSSSVCRTREEAITSYLANGGPADKPAILWQEVWDDGARSNDSQPFTTPWPGYRWGFVALLSQPGEVAA